MAKLIITVSGRLNVNGPKIREFRWCTTRNTYLYLGREFTAAEFNSAYEKAWRNNSDLMPKALVVDASPDAPVDTAQLTELQTAIGKERALVESLTAERDALAAKMSEPRELTLEEAEAFMVKHAPDRLKKKAGRPPGPPTLDVS
jgi:hypothetical protein